MKFTPTLSACIAALCIFTSSPLYAMEKSGQNGRVEWNTQQSWATGGKVLGMVHSMDAKYVFMLTDKQQVKIFNRLGQLQGSIPVDKGVSAIDIAPQGETLYLMDNTKESFSSIDISFIADIDTGDAPTKGIASAPVSLVIFTDFECPYCHKILPLLDEILARNPKTVKIVFKNMPLRFHKMAIPSALAALAAKEQGKFWDFHDRLFAEENLSEEAILGIAKDLGLDLTKFNRDRQSGRLQTRLQKDMLDAQKAGVTGTPTVFINGRTPHQRSLDGYQALIDDELSKVSK